MFSVYRRFVLDNVPRLLSQLDRRADSATYGCFDRNYWHFKIRDFPSAILQQGALSLSLLYLNDFPGNIYFNREKVRNWAIAAVDFWSRIQLKDGSFNEYYPNEHGYPPTAFSLYAAAETCRLLEHRDEELIKSMLNAAKYLSRIWETEALNQEIASIAALYSTYLVAKEDWILDSVEAKLQAALEKQSDEGWFPEYGGADLGYLSVSLDFLAEYYSLSRDERVLEPLNRMIDFVQYFVHPNSTIGGDYGSRNTEYFLPNGLEVLASTNETARAVLNKLNKNIDTPGYFQSTFDDRYISHYVLHSFIRAMLRNEIVLQSDYKLPCEVVHRTFFEGAGLYVLNTGSYYAVLGVSKAGVLKVYSADTEIFNDYGYRAKLKNGDLVTTSWPDKYQIEANGDRFRILGQFHQVPVQTPSPFEHVLLRLAAFWLGRRLIPLLKKKAIFAGRKVPISFVREVSFQEDSISISDYISSEQTIPELYTADNFSLRHVASSKYFTVNEFCGPEPRVFKGVKNVKLNKMFDVKALQLRYNDEQSE